MKKNKDKLRERLINRITKIIELACEECDIDWPQITYGCIGRCTEIIALSDGIEIRTVIPDDPAKWPNNISVFYKKATGTVGNAFQLIDCIQSTKDRMKQDCDVDHK